MKKFSLISSIICLSFCGCSSSNLPKTNHTLYLNIPSDPPSLDPRKASDTTSISVIRMCFDGLLRRDKDGRRSYGVASEMKVDQNQTRFTFYLKNTFWSDGAPVTAYDFERAYKSILAPDFASEFASELFIIKNAKAVKEGSIRDEFLGVRALSDYILEITLEYSAPYFLDMLMTHAYFPIPSHKLNQDLSWDIKDGSSYVCNGPFLITKWSHNNKIALAKNDNYWDAAAVSIQHVELSMVEDGMTELSMYQNGDLDYMGSPLSSIPVDALEQVSKEDEFSTYPISGTYYYIFNTKAFPFTNRHIRQAFSLSIHRKEIVENILQGGQKPALSFIPPTMLSEDNNLFNDADIDLALEEFNIGLKELNLTKETFPSVKLSFNTQSAHHKIAQAIQQQWASALGVTVELENMEWKVFLDKVHAHQFQIARMGGVASYNDPASFLKDYQYGDTRINPSQWSDKRYSELMQISDTLSDPKERKKVLLEAEKIFIEQMPLAPIYFYSGNYLKKPYLRSLQLSELSDLDIKFCSLERP